MGFGEGKIFLDNKNSNGNFIAGQVIQGRLEFQQVKDKTFRGIYVELKGSCKVHWTTSHTRRVDGRDEHYTKVHQSDETYVDYRMYLAGAAHGKHTLRPGQYSYPFQMTIPQHCPSSFEGEYGHVRYKLKFVMDREMLPDKEKMISVIVDSLRDLNTDPNSRQPIQMDFEESYCCWCVGAGKCFVEIRAPAASVCPGQTLALEVRVDNRSNVEIDTIKFEIKEATEFIASYEPGTRYDSRVIVKVKKGPIPGHTNRNWTVELDVPEMDLKNMDTCKYIDIAYRLKVEISTSGCHTDEDDVQNIVLGHIPLNSTENGTSVVGPINPTTPLAPHLVVSQPLSAPPGLNPYVQGQPGFVSPQVSPFPAPSPYPSPIPQYSPNPPYPGVNPQVVSPNPPYPGVNPPIVSPNPPYAGVNIQMSPYPGANSPAVSPNPPYPSANPPYPGANAPYPGANPPYPGANPPYPGANPPYAGANPHIPSPNLPYPGGNSPYPAGNTSASPYPGNRESPLPPVGAPSAPEPSTPGGDSPAPFPTTPAYNPQFVPPGSSN